MVILVILVILVIVSVWAIRLTACFFDRFADWAKGTRAPANTPRVLRVAAMHLPWCVTMHLVEVLVTMRYKRVGI